MSTEYRAAVLKAYLAKRNNNTLSRNLIDPTPGMIKSECIEAFKWYKKTDDSTLKLFVEKKDNGGTYLQAFKNEPAETFKAMSNFFKSKTEDPVDRTIELLAFLIDFKPRPYTYGWKVPELINVDVPHDEEMDQTGTATVVLPGNTGGSSQRTSPEPVDKESRVQQWTRFLKNKNTRALAVVLILISGGAFYTIIRGNIFSKEEAGCMVWLKDHYIRTPCVQPNDGSLIVPLDTFKLAHLKKITDTSKVDRNSLRHTWYFGHAKRPECFTAAGPYPPDTARRLLPITEHIIRKYFHW